MKTIFRFICLILFLMTSLGTAQAGAGTDAFKKEIQTVFKEKDFLKLENIASEAREKKDFFPDGLSRLEAFYDSFYVGDASIEDIQAQIRLLEEWNQTVKNSVTANILLGTTYSHLAWAYRGDGWGASVTESGGKRFREFLKTALKYLHTAEEINGRDPEIYRCRIRAFMGLGVPKVMSYEDVTRTLQIFPGYFPVYAAMVHFLLPRWRGESGDVERFASWLGAMTREDYGDQMYAWAAVKTFYYVGEDSFYRFHFDQNRIIKGFKEYYQRFPGLSYDVRRFSKILAKAGEWNLARDLMTRLESKILDSPEELLDDENYQYWRGVVFGDIEAIPDNEVLAAVREGRFDDLKAAVERGDDINARDFVGNSPLLLALTIRDREMAKYLIEQGADLEIENNDKEAPIHIAVRNNMLDVIQMMIAKGVDPRKKNKAGWTAFHLAVTKGFVDVVKVFLEHDSDLITFEGPDQFRALDFAAANGYPDIVEYLLSLNSDIVNLQSDFGSTALHYAAKKDHYEVAKILLDHGADVSLMTDRGYTPLNYALESKNLKLINLLKENGAREGETAVSYDAAVDAFEHYQKGDAYYKSNNFQAAQSEFLKSIEINPRHFESYQYLTVLLAMEKKWDEMIAYFDRFLDLEPDHAMAYFKRAWVYHQKRDLDKMNADLIKACDLGNIEACQRLGRAPR